MANKDLVVIGAVAGAHGVRGDAKLKPFGDPASLKIKQSTSIA